MTRVLLSFMVAMLSLASNLLAQDNVPPTLNCPGNTTLQLLPGQCEIVHNFMVSATDNAPGCTPTIAQIDGTGYTSGSYFPIGTTTLRFRATDCSNNQSTCQFNIIVNAYVPPTNALICDDNLHISLPGSCETWLTPDAALEGYYGCYDDFVVNVEFTGSNYIGYNYVGETIMFTVINTRTGNQCMGEALVEDKSGPSISNCIDHTVICLEDVRPVSAGGDIPDPIFEDCMNFTTQYVDMVTPGTCSDPYSQQIMRIWSATDELGYNSTCSQMITVNRISLSDITPICPGEVTIECNPAVAANTSPSVTGYPTVLIKGITYPITEGANSICNITATYSDLIIPKCGVGYRVIRTWSVLDWCLPINPVNNPWTCTQIIHYNDTTAPQFNAPANMSVTANLAGCRARPVIPAVNISDCSSYSVAIFTPVGTIPGNGGQIPQPGLPFGLHTITIKVTDACGNSTSKTFTINVLDNTKPNAVCDQFTVVALDDYGYGFANAETFDNGSTDNCCLDYFHARRMTDNCNIPENLVFDEYVEFCCDDVGAPVQVIFRVFDCHGNFNDCMVNVEVQDKSGPSITCPPNATLYCGQDYTNPTLVGTVETDPALQGPLDGLAIDNCGLDIVVSQSDAGSVTCGAGTVYRTYAATDPAGTSSFCVQTITVINNNPFTGGSIVFPDDITLNGCTSPTTPATTGSPTYPAPNGCHSLVSGYIDLPLTNAPDACLKILRTWSVIDWCQYDLNNPGAGGIWTDVQVIKVMDGVAPTFASCANRTFCNFKDDCSDLAPDLSVSPTDLCTPTNQILLSWTVDLYDDGVSDPGYATSGSGQNTTNNYPVGTHRISYRATDGCGNSSFCNFLFAIEDCKAPSPVCVNGLIVEIMASGMVPVNASSLLDPSSSDNCSAFGDLDVSFSPNLAHVTNIYTCDDLGTNVVQIWLTDDDGNADFCETFVVIQDNMGACAGVPLIAINGRIANESNQGLEDVDVDLNGNVSSSTITGINGAYQFPGLPLGQDYTVTPSLNRSPLNGVTTFDLLLINQHILGSVPFDSPFKIIAADANRTGSVTVSDIVELRKLVLHVTDQLPNNPAWRFVDASFVFPNQNNPFATVFPEVCNINDLSTNSPSVNFIAIKIGDVNGTAVTNIASANADERNAQDYFFKIAERKVEAGESVTVDFNANLANMLGYQFTLNFDQTALRFEKLSPSANVSIENFGLNQLEQGVITTSWYRLAAEKMGKDETQFSITFTALKAGTLSELLNINSSHTLAESYEKGGEIRPVALEFTKENGGSVYGAQFELYQNVPNPFTGETIIRFQLPVASTASLTIYNMEGKAMKTVSGEFAKGYHEVTIEAGRLPSSGVFYYRLQTPGYTATRKMTLIK